MHGFRGLAEPFVYFTENQRELRSPGEHRGMGWRHQERQKEEKEGKKMTARHPEQKKSNQTVM